MYRELLQQAEKALITKKAEKALLKKQLEHAEKIKDEALLEIMVLEKVALLLQTASEFARAQAKSKIEQIVTSALTAVFESNYAFRLDIVTRSNRVEVDYFLQSGSTEVQLSGADFNTGGGIIDVICLAMRLAIIELVGSRGAIVLDEPGKHVSAEFAPNVAVFLKTYSENFHRQIIMVTHNEALSAVADNTIHITQRNGVSIAK